MNEEHEFERAKKESDALYEEIAKCAYLALHEYPPGKKLMEHLTARLFNQIGWDCKNIWYVVGENDYLRMLKGLINHHKNGGIS